jgi:hypothetical protein
MVEIGKRTLDVIKQYGSSEEINGIVVQPWVNGFLQVLLHHLKTHKQDHPETQKILQNFTT